MPLCEQCEKEFNIKHPTQKYCCIRCYYDSNIGKKFSEESRKKMSESHLGQKAWNRGIRYKAIEGSKNPNWSGGKTKRPKDSFIHRMWRRAVFERDNYTCQECGVRGKYIEAHHIKKYNDYPELRTELTNGITLCNTCHNKTKFKETLFEDKYTEMIKNFNY